jgi:threonine efflux protein
MNHELIILASLAAVYIPVLISPGPNFLVVTQSAISQTRRHAVYTALGIASGSTILACLAATSVGLLLAHFSWFERAVHILGGAYLLYIGMKIWLQAKQSPAPQATVGRGPGAEQSYWYAYWYGMATNLTNPKGLVFFATIFASLLTPSLPGSVRLAGVALICLCSTLWHVTLANWFSGAQMQEIYRAAKRTINRVTAVVLIAVGIKLLWVF